MYEPDAPGKFPVILERSPYDKAHPLYDDKCRRLAERGYVVVVQDTRGRCASDGELEMGFFSSDHPEAKELKNDEHALDDWPRVRLFIMGRNEWRSADEWPLPGTQYTEFYLHSSGNASDVEGDGVLSHTAPALEPADSYSYDPRDPVMSIFTMGAGHGPFDQCPLDERRDILRFTTPHLEEAVEVTGPVCVKLFAASSVRDTDFTARLIDVCPDGFAHELCYGIVRARYRDSFETPTLIEPGKVYEYHIEMNPTGNVFLPGHRIRLDISSSDFPNFDRNHNTGGDDYCESTLVTAQQTVSHDMTRPSRIVLPVIPA